MTLKDSTKSNQRVFRVLSVQITIIKDRDEILLCLHAWSLAQDYEQITNEFNFVLVIESHESDSVSRLLGGNR